MALYLRPTASIAAHAILPADPGAALALAQDLLGQPRMSNHHHGLWGYHGETGSGAELTIQATGIGGPSAAIVLRELSELGVRRAIRLGACPPAHARAPAGGVIVVERALAGDGTSAALGADGVVAADRVLTDELRRAVGADADAGAVASVDIALDGASPPSEAVAIDLESAALLTLGKREGIEVGSILVVGDDEGATIRAGRIAAAALAGAQGRSTRPEAAARS
jgi:uridine phosphorylase